MRLVEEELVPATDLKTRSGELLRKSAERDVVLLRYGRPTGVLVSWDKYTVLVDQLRRCQAGLHEEGAETLKM